MSAAFTRPIFLKGAELGMGTKISIAEPVALAIFARYAKPDFSTNDPRCFTKLFA